MRFRIAPSGVGDYFKHKCDKSLVYNALPEREEIGWPEKKDMKNSLKKAGIKWEEQVVNSLRESGINVAEPSKGSFSKAETADLLRKAEDGYIYQSTINFSEDFLNTFILKLDSPSDQTGLQFIWSDSHPDLIRVTHDENGCPVFRVIDVKLAKKQRLNHKIQVALYILMLESMLKEYGIDGAVDKENGYLWNYGNDSEKPFSVQDITVFLAAFLSEGLPSILRKTGNVVNAFSGTAIGEELDRVLPYRISQQCEWCDKYEDCKAWCEKNEPLMLLPYLSVYGQDFLWENKDIPRDISGFMKYISEDENLNFLKKSSSVWSRRLANIDNSIKALSDTADRKEDNVYLNQVYLMEMPRWQDIRIILTAHKDEGTDSIYAYGISVGQRRGLDILEIGMNENGFASEKRLFIAASRDETAANTESFIEYFYGLLEKVNNYNISRKYDECISVQSYVMDNYEEMNISEALFGQLLRDDVSLEYRMKVMQLVFYLQGERMITDMDKQAGSLGTDFPIVVITTMISRLYTLPAYVAYNLHNISAAFSPEYIFDPSDYYCHKLSNALKSDAINDIWDLDGDEKSAKVKQLKKHLLIRLGVEGNIISRVQRSEITKGSVECRIRRNAHPFRFCDLNMAADVRQAKLQIENLYESMLDFHEIRRIRMGDMEQAAEEGKVMKVRLIRENTLKNKIKVFVGRRPSYMDAVEVYFELLNDDTFYGDGWFSYMLVENSDEGLSQAATLLDKNIMVLPSENYKNLYSLTDMEIIEPDNKKKRGGRKIVRAIRLSTNQGKEKLVAGDEFFIVEIHNTINTERVNNLFGYMSEESRAKVTSLYPESYYHNMGVSFKDYKESLMKWSHPDGMSFTGSQEKAFRQLFEKNITLLLGPPGTGKTDFIARSIMVLSSFYERILGRKLKVLVTANSHAAIDNILAKTAQKIRAAKEMDVSLPMLYKLDRFDEGNAIDGVSLMYRRHTYDVERRCDDLEDGRIVFNDVLAERSMQPVVIGSSCWSICLSMYGRYSDLDTYFDMVIIDEASQLKTMDSVISLGAGNITGDTRYLIVGDENQLPPILRGRYEAENEPVYFYGSVFRMFYDTCYLYGLDYLVQLEENFRMNEILSRYSAKMIYDADIVPGDGRVGYRAYRGEDGSFGGIAEQKLRLDIEINELTSEIRGDDYLYRIADPDYPLIFIRLSGGASYEKDDAEMKLALEITGFLKKHMFKPDEDIHYVTDEEFWGTHSGEGAFAIISPHHEHINRLKSLICDSLGSDRNDLFIGTVDRLQGQEREAVLVSYGINDIAKALGEGEFIYSRNRMNVALTRGKKKVICILTDVLTDKSLETLEMDDDETVKGVSYVAGIRDFMESQETDTCCDKYEMDMGNVHVEIFRKRCIF